MNSLIAEIKNEIMEKFAEWKSEGGGDIDEFKLNYGNHENCLYYYKFKIEGNLILPCIAYIAKSMEDAGLEDPEFKRFILTHLIHLKVFMVYWVMEEIDFEKDI
tara:strand:- start:527 stop:838 length:312 start_codon:yes stop_codon:yes gene_type:complete